MAKMHLDAICADLEYSTQLEEEYTTPPQWPKPRRVQPDQPQLKDMGNGGKLTAVNSIMRSGAKTTLTGSTHHRTRVTPSLAGIKLTS